MKKAVAKDSSVDKTNQQFLEIEMLKKALNIINSGIIIIDKEGKVIYSNEAARPAIQLLKTTSLNEIPNAFRLRKVDGTFITADEMPLKRCINENTIVKDQLLATDTDGSEKYTDVTAIPIQNEHGILEGGMVIYQDVTSLKQHEAALQNALSDKTLLFTAIEATSDIVIISDYYGKLIYINSATRKTFNIEKEAVIADIVMKDYHTKESWDLVTKKMVPKAMVTGSSSGDITLINKNGKFIYLSQVLICKKDIKGKVDFFASISRDISDQKSNETKLAQQQDYLYSIIDANPNLIFVKDVSGKYKLINKKFSKTTGTSIKNIVGKSDFEIPVPKEAAEKYQKEDLKIISGKVKTIVSEEKYIVNKSEEQRWLQTVKTALRLPNGEIEILGVATDITDIKLIEANLKRQLHFSEQIARISSDFFSIEHTEIDKVMVESLKTICTNTEMTRALIGEVDTYGKIKYKHVWSNDADDEILKGKYILEDFKDLDFNWTLEQINKKGYAFSGNTDDFFDTDKIENEILKKIQIKSFLILPIQSKKKRIGYLIMSSFNKSDLPKAELVFIKTICQILSTAIEKADAEKMMKFRLSFEEIITSISSNFISVEPTLILEEITQSLKTIGEFIGADQSYVFAYNKEKHVLNLTNSWFLDNRNPKDGYYWDIPYESFPWAFEKVQKNNYLAISNTNEIPKEGTMLKDVMDAGGVKSMLAVPITIRNDFTGTLILASFEKEKFWHDEAIPLFKILGQVFANALERKKNDDKIRESESLYRAISSNIPKTAVYVFDKNLKIIIAEGKTFDELGLDKTKIEGKYFSDLKESNIFPLSNDEYSEYESYYNRTLNGEEFTIEKNYEKNYYQIYISPIKNIDQQIISILLISFDITEFKGFQQKLQNQAFELQRSNEDLEQFAYAASHDLQEPLRMVSSYVHLIERKLGENLSTDVKEFIFYATDGVKRMQELINDLLEYSRVERKGKAFSTIDLNNVMHAVKFNLQKIIADNSVEIICSELPKLKADYSQISSLFQNLIDNAIKFKSDKKPLITIGYTEQKNKYTFYVKDNGIGIDKKYADRIFVIFQRLNNRTLYPGTGIGLSICKKIVERHGGSIWIESTINEGTTFFFELKK